jgi:hypothetical protein
MVITIRVVGLLACLVLAAGCGGRGESTPTAPSSASGSPSGPSSPTAPATTPAPAPATVAGALQVLATRAIYFGHQSVGSNIISGVQAQIAANPGTTLRVVGTSSASALPAGVFAHASNGSNGDPGGKNDAFEATIRAGVGGTADIAFFKYCYVDVTSTSNAGALFDDYRSHMAALKSGYPRVRFVHVTVPLTTGSSADNTVRERFNSLMRQAFSGVEPLFDLAVVESTAPDGSTVMVGGVRAMAPAYSSDGGHLNTTGQEVVAKALLLYLASL